jgi:hypothetical protein
MYISCYSPAARFSAFLWSTAVYHHFPESKIEGVPLYISYYSPTANFFNLYCAPIHHFPDIKTKGVPWYISSYSSAAQFLAFLWSITVYHHFSDSKIKGVPWYISYYSPTANFFSLCCAPIHYSTTFRILKLKVFRGTSHVIPLLRIFFSLPVIYYGIPPLPGW